MVAEVFLSLIECWEIIFVMIEAWKPYDYFRWKNVLSILKLKFTVHSIFFFIQVGFKMPSEVQDGGQQLKDPWNRSVCCIEFEFRSAFFEGIILAKNDRPIQDGGSYPNFLLNLKKINITGVHSCLKFIKPS
jgi:hypothetical protein